MAQTDTNYGVLFARHINTLSTHGDELRGCCPFHNDRTPSWSGNTVTGLWRCFGCGAKGNATQLAERLGEEAPTHNGQQRRTIIATYDYRDEQGRLLFQSVRYEPKEFKQRKPDGRGGWLWTLDGVRRVLYRLPEILQEQVVYIAEGEKDVERLWLIDIPATTNPQGAGKWRTEYNESLRNKQVVILPDNDEPGERHALQVARSLLPFVSALKIVHLPELPPKGDVSAWLDAGHTREELLKIVTKTPLFTQEASDTEHGHATGDEQDPETAPERKPPWPELAEDALYGLAGEIVNAIDPYTEADKAAVLITLLTMFGNCVGNTPHFLVERTKHCVRLFIALVGQTAKGRKGQSLSTLRYMFEQVDPDWSRDRVVFGGASSGEGLIDAVRDPRMDDKGDVVDTGETDKRLLLIEEELVSVLKVASRDGNTLSAILRQAWDRGDLRPLTKHNKIRATGAHVSIVSHITSDELLRHLTATEQSNGFGNRFLWLLVKRSKLIPHPIPVPDDTLAPLIDELRKAVDFARKTTVLDRDMEAEAIWEGVYPDLSEAKPGLFGAIIGRAEAQVMRLASGCALLNCSPRIKAVHLRAGLALWEYSEESARLIFGDTLGDPLADSIYQALCNHPEGLTRTEINNYLGRHQKAEEIARALSVLLKQGKARCVEEVTTGRTAERWFSWAKEAKEAN